MVDRTMVRSEGHIKCLVNFISKEICCLVPLRRDRDGCAVGYTVHPASGRLGVRMPATTGLKCSTAKRSAIGVSVTVPWK